MCYLQLEASSHPSYLIDTDRDAEGLAVISDFAGTGEDDPKVLEEYNEIRDGVLADVGWICGGG